MKPALHLVRGPAHVCKYCGQQLTDPDCYVLRGDAAFCGRAQFTLDGDVFFNDLGCSTRAYENHLRDTRRDHYRLTFVFALLAGLWITATIVDFKQRTARTRACMAQRCELGVPRIVDDKLCACVVLPKGGAAKP